MKKTVLISGQYSFIKGSAFRARSSIVRRNNIGAFFRNYLWMIVHNVEYLRIPKRAKKERGWATCLVYNIRISIWSSLKCLHTSLLWSIICVMWVRTSLSKSKRHTDKPGLVRHFESLHHDKSETSWEGVMSHTR